MQQDSTLTEGWAKEKDGDKKKKKKKKKGLRSVQWSRLSSPGSCLTKEPSPWISIQRPTKSPDSTTSER